MTAGIKKAFGPVCCGELIISGIGLGHNMRYSVQAIAASDGCGHEAAFVSEMNPEIINM